MKNIKTNQENQTRTIQSKFGDIEINESSAVEFPHGILGFSDATKFCFVNSQVEKFKNFVYMQSTQEDELVFLARPLDLSDQNLISNDDLNMACEQLSLRMENLAVVLIVSAKNLESGQKVLVANVKAPIFIDIESHTARQYVFQNSDYNTQHIL